MNQIIVPSKIKSFIDNKPYTVDDIGQSGNQVLIFKDMVLKADNVLNPKINEYIEDTTFPEF